jgi:anti-anti-sigma factor
MKPGKYLCASRDGILFLKLGGDVRYTNSAGFEAFLDRILEEGAFDDVVVDLTEVESIDSTNLGLLARIGNHTLERHHRKTTMISTDSNVNQILHSVGFDEAFLLIEHPEDLVCTFEEVPAAADDEHRLACRMLEAHRALMRLNEQNKARFQNVVEILEARLRKKDDRDNDRQAGGD